MSERTYSNGQLTARIVKLEAAFTAFKELMVERDMRYAQRSASQDEAVRSALETSEKAITKAESATERRFEGVNEFRATLADQASTLLPRAEYNAQHSALEEKVNFFEKRLHEFQATILAMQAHGGGLKEAWGYIVAGSSALAALAIYLITRGK
jgi:hypothetical protein